MIAEIHMMVQQSEEWDALKVGRLSGSKAQEIGNHSKGLNTLTTALVMNIYQGKKSDDDFCGYEMQRGNRLEPIGKTAYEMENEVVIQEIGCGTIGMFIACSPDGLIGKDGGIELKARNDKIHWNLVMGDENLDSKTIWQCNFNMYVFDCKWWDFCSYNPHFKEKSLFVQRIFRDEEKIRELEKGIEIGIEQIKTKIDKARLRGLHIPERWL